jgi:hypothetical protein
MSGADPMIVRRWHVGQDHRATLIVPRPPAGELPTCTLTWWPRKPKTLSTADRAEFDQGIESAFRIVERALGMRPPFPQL